MTHIYAEIFPDDEKDANSMDICKFVTKNLKDGRCVNAFVVDDDSEVKTKYRAYLALYAMVMPIKKTSAPLTFAEYEKMEEEE